MLIQAPTAHIFIFSPYRRPQCVSLQIVRIRTQNRRSLLLAILLMTYALATVVVQKWWQTLVHISGGRRFITLSLLWFLFSLSLSHFRTLYFSISLWSSAINISIILPKLSRRIILAVRTRQFLSVTALEVYIFDRHFGANKMGLTDSVRSQSLTSLTRRSIDRRPGFFIVDFPEILMRRHQANCLSV